MHDFTYHAPATLAEAFDHKSKAAAGGRFLAGGTDLFLAMEWGQADVGTVIDLKGIPELSGVEKLPDGGYRIGALTRMAQIENDEALRAALPALADAAAVVGGPPIRNRATVGGNLCNASPAADTSTPLLALGAEVVLASAAGERTVPLAELWSGPRNTTLQPGELLKEVHVPALPPGGACAFERLTRTVMDIAVVNAAAVVAVDKQGRFASAALALGAVAPTVLAVPEVNDELKGQACDEAALERVRAAAERAARPIDDQRASADYRREMAGVLAARAVRRAHELAAGKGGRS
jgi:carbon-monoxide dehydrogenase medium subunit